MKKAWAGALFYMIACGVVPCALLYYEFKDHAITYATTYGHFFLYPLFFGWIPALIVTRTLPYISKSLDSKSKERKFWLGLVILSFIALFLELQSTNIAPWEIKQERLVANNIQDYFESTSKTDNEKKIYQDAMLMEIENVSHWSYVRYAYIFSFLIQAATLLSVFFCSGALLAHRINLGILQNGEPYLDKTYRGALSLITIAASICLLYSFARISFNHEKAYYFISVSNEVSTWVLLYLFLAAMLFLAASLYFWIGRHLQPILTFAFGGTSAAIAFKNPEILYSIFGRKAGLISYLTIAGGMLVCYWVWDLFIPSIDDVMHEDTE